MSPINFLADQNLTTCHCEHREHVLVSGWQDRKDVPGKNIYMHVILLPLRKIYSKESSKLHIQ